MSSRTQLALIVVGLLAALAGGYFLLVGRQAAKAEELQTQIADLETKITEARLASRRAAAAPKHEKVRVADLFRLSKAMPDQTDMPGVVLELNRVARETGIEFESIVPGQAAPAAGFQVVPIELVFEGDFYDLADFLYRTRTLVGVRDGELDARGRLFNVDKIEFNEGETLFPSIRASIRLEAYVYGTGAPVAPVAPAPEATAPETALPPTEAPAPPPEGATALGAMP